MTFMEALVSMVIVAIMAVATINGYLLSTSRAEWSSHSLAAHSLAMQRLEQTRAASWSLAGEFPVDELTVDNFPTLQTTLDLPVAGTNAVHATVYTSITNVSVNPPFRLIRVECVWPYRNRGFFTNHLVTYRSAEQ